MNFGGGFYFLAIVCSTLSSALGAKILVSSLIPGPTSHALALSAIAGALTRRGHNVTIFSSSLAGLHGFKKGNYEKALHYELNVPPHLPSADVLQKQFAESAFNSDGWEKIRVFSMMFYMIRFGCSSIFEDSATMAQLQEADFDLLISDSFDGCDAIFSAYLDKPFIAVTTGTRYPLFNEHSFGIPAPSSYVPFGVLPLTDNMSFFERVASFLEHNVIDSLLRWYFVGAYNELKDKLGIAPGKSVFDLQASAEFWIGTTSNAFDFPRPSVPNYVSIAGLTAVPAKPLSKEYADFVEGSGDNGFIVFSLGSQFSEIPDRDLADAFAKVFSELPQRVIWRHTGPRPRHLGNNTMLVKWVPQNDLLANPKCRLLIYHGGLAGIYEAITHGVPMVIMPLFAEQPANALRVEVKGMGMTIQKDDVTYENLKETVLHVLGNPSYLENVKHYSAIYQDRIAKPDETVVYWVEHILKFGGSHLRTRAKELTFIQLHSIDVLAFFCVIIFFILFILYSCLNRCLSCCFKGKKTKVE